MATPSASHSKAAANQQSALPFSLDVCRQARLSRDTRFDGQFFIAVKTTGIFCRNVCPAVTPKENNIHYYGTAVEASQAGFRPCLRCRPDSAPGSFAWLGVETSVLRAVRLIDEGVLHQGSVVALAERLGVSDRYLRKLFRERFGVGPKEYSLFGQVMFAKKLLHETLLPMTEVAFASGFNSVRRFNDCFRKTLNLSPTDIRRKEKIGASVAVSGQPQVTLQLSYRGHFNWQHTLDYLAQRALPEVEWIDGQHYGRTFDTRELDLEGDITQGHFVVSPEPKKRCLNLTVSIEDATRLLPVVHRIRALFDLNADLPTVEAHLHHSDFPWVEGIRIPGIWSVFEAGVRAIIGQQISIAAARTQLTRLVAGLGAEGAQGRRLFPTPAAVANSDLSMLKMPEARKQTLQALAQWVLDHNEERTQDPDAFVESWQQIKGIGPWTTQYVAMRALHNPDIWLATDLGIKKALAEHPLAGEQLAPWRSYGTFQLWNSLANL